MTNRVTFQRSRVLLKNKRGKSPSIEQGRPKDRRRAKQQKIFRLEMYSKQNTLRSFVYTHDDEFDCFLLLTMNAFD